ncbi:hypothetical protein ACJJTC_004193, partial [Scirpophaga incertulas]
SVRNLQAKLKSQQQAQAQREEVLSKARQSEIDAISELTQTLKEKDDLKAKVEENKMRIIDLEIELNESSLILTELLKISKGQESSNIQRSKSFFELQKSGKVVERLDRCRYSRSFNDLHVMHRDKNQTNLQKLTRKISDLTKEIAIKNSKIIEQQRCISILEDALRENNNIAEFEQLLAVVRSKDERINELELVVNKKSGKAVADYKDKRILELEDALKESVLIAAEREKVFYEEEQRRIETLQKMRKMEQRIKSLQNASALSCDTCSPLMRRLAQLRAALGHCRDAKLEVLHTLARAVQNILEELITEKDSQIAELELKGVLDENESAKCDALKSERDRARIGLRLSGVGEERVGSREYRQLAAGAGAGRPAAGRRAAGRRAAGRRAAGRRALPGEPLPGEPLPGEPLPGEPLAAPDGDDNVIVWVLAVPY